MSVRVRDFLKRRRDRALGTIMGALEASPLWSRLNDEQRAFVRDRVIEALNSYHDTVLDLLKAETDVVRNDEVLAALTRLDTDLRRSGALAAPVSVEAAPISTHVSNAHGQLPEEVAR